MRGDIGEGHAIELVALHVAAALAHELHRSEGRGPEMVERLKRMRK